MKLLEQHTDGLRRSTFPHDTETGEICECGSLQSLN